VKQARQPAIAGDMRQTSSGTAMPRRGAIVVAVLYGVFCHVAFVAGVGAMMVVLFSGMTLGLGRLPQPWSWFADALLLLQFPLLHTALLSRRGGAALRRLAPPGLGTPLMTTTYALIASLQTGLLFLGWTPIGRVLWQAHGATLVVFAICYAGAWLLLLKAIVDAGFALQTGLLGWRAVVRGQAPVYPPMPTRGLFRLIRQPIYVAFALTLWTVPTITPDGLVVAVVLTAYCLIGSMVKEARFARRFGTAFADYCAKTPFWVPVPPRGKGP
jgi:protein-S-isoprenylcysteine O-methyltransferase Ste14